MSWKDAPVVPAEEWEKLRETPEQRAERARIAADVSSDPRNFHPGEQHLVQPRPAGMIQVATPAPSAAAWMSAPEVPEAAGAKASAWESAPIQPSWWDTISAIPATAVGQVKQALGGLMQQTAEEGELFSARMGEAVKAAKGEKPNLDVQLPETPSTEVTKGRELAARGKAEVEGANPGELDFWKKAVLMGGSNVLSQIPALAVGVVTRSPTAPLAAAGAMASGTEYSEQREAGQTQRQASTSANLVGTTEILTEFLPTQFLTDSIGKPVLQTIIKVLAADVPGELLQTTIQSANAKLTRDPDMTWEQYGQDLLDTLGATAVSAPLLGGTAAAINRLPGVREKSKQAPAETPAVEEPAVEAATAGAVAGVVGPTLPPNIDEPTVILDSETEQQIKIDLNSIDPEQIDEKQLTEGRRLIEEERKKSKAPALPAAEAAWSQISTAPTTAVEDAGELGASARQAANAPNYINPNQGDRLDRPFLYGPEGFAGLTPRQVLPKPGVYTLGAPSEDRPADYLRALHDSMTEWQQKYLPNDVIVISNEQLFTNSALGWHYNTDANSHMIVPAVLRKPSRGLGAYNPNTQASAFYNATHEFGHALIVSKFYEGVQDLRVIRDESKEGLVRSIEALPAPQQAVVVEFNAMKQRVIDGSMTAQEFVDTWMGPAKSGQKTFLSRRKISPNAPARDLINQLAKQAADESNIAHEVKRKTLMRQMKEELLSLDEYLAEQTARHAYKQKWDEKSPIGKFFSEALRGLRGFFVDRKKDGIIAPGVAFQEWLDGIGKTARPGNEIENSIANKKRAGKKIPKKIVAPEDLMYEAEKKESKKPRVRIKKVAHNVHSSTEIRTQAKFKKNIDYLVTTKAINKTQADELQTLINRNEYDEFIELFQKYAVKNVSFEYAGDLNVAREDPDWRQEKFNSPEFRAWFGEWQEDPARASVARVGVFIQHWDGTMTVEKDLAAPPLVVFAPKERILAGENVFHAGTLRGVHFAEANHPQPVEDPAVVPVVLNIRNPYIVGDFEYAAPKREELETQGYDGIVYQNDFEGDVSFVVFSPAQVKVVPDRAPYGRDSGLHLELDHDQATPEGAAAGKFFNGVKNFLNSQGPLRRALRKVTHLSRYTLQLQQLAQIYPDLSDLSYLNTENSRYTRYGASRRVEADRLVTEWEDMGAKAYDRINRALIKQYESRERWFEIYRDEKLRQGDVKPVPWYKVRMTENSKKKLKEAGIDIETEQGIEDAQFMLRHENILLDHLNETEQILIEVLSHRFGHSMPRLQAEVTDLRVKVHEMRKVPFLPQGRFGNFMLTISRKREQGPGYEVIYKEAFESEAKWIEAAKKADASKKPDEIVRKHQLNDQEYVLMSLPHEFINLLGSELGLSDTPGANGEPSQMERLAEILQPVKQEKILSKFEEAQRGLKGYSTDLLRSFANFTWHNSNAQAKLLYRRKFNLAITNMRQRLRAAETADVMDEQEIGRLGRVVRAMETMRDYVMAPPYEAQNLRAIVSLSYLAFNVKTALINFYGTVTTFSSATSEKGVADGSRRLGVALAQAVKSLRLVDLDTRRKGDYLPPDIQRGLDLALEQGTLSQSYAYHLASAAGERPLARLSIPRLGSRITRKMVDAGMYPFRLMELFTRRVTFLYALQTKLENKELGFDEAYEAAVSQTSALQNDYSAGNRVPFMRGTGGVLGAAVPMATIFGSFAQHMAFHGYGGYELGQRRAKALAIQRGELPVDQMPQWYQWGYGYTARIWLITLFLAGYEGLPGAENLIDLIEAVYRRFGWKPIRQELREMVQAIDQDPVMFSHGLGANVLGFDVSRSLGFGRIFPGTDIFSRASPQTPEEAVGSFALDMLGPTGGLMKFGLEWFNKTTTEGLMEGTKQSAKKMPGGVGNIINAYIWSQEGVRGPSGGLITLEPDETGKLRPRELTADEIWGKALGFNPEIVAKNRAKNWANYDQKIYWQTKRGAYTRAWIKAKDRDDPEAFADAKRAISDFNEDVPNEDWSKGLKISGKDLNDAWKRFRRNKRLEERGLPRERRYRPLAEDIRQSFESPEE